MVRCRYLFTMCHISTRHHYCSDLLVILDIFMYAVVSTYMGFAGGGVNFVEKLILVALLA